MAASFEVQLPTRIGRISSSTCHDLLFLPNLGIEDIIDLDMSGAALVVPATAITLSPTFFHMLAQDGLIQKLTLPVLRTYLESRPLGSVGQVRRRV